MCHFIILTNEYSFEDLAISQILEESSLSFSILNLTQFKDIWYLSLTKDLLLMSFLENLWNILYII